MIVLVASEFMNDISTSATVLQPAFPLKLKWTVDCSSPYSGNPDFRLLSTLLTNEAFATFKTNYVYDDLIS